MECNFCKELIEEEYLIKKYKFWTISLHKNQCYLGRCIIETNRHTEDLLDTTPKERRELWKIIKLIYSALCKSFKPDLFNYAIFGNKDRHLHLHIIPRYKTARKFGGIEFVDMRWGHNYKPEQKDFRISTRTFIELRDTIRRLL